MPVLLPTPTDLANMPWHDRAKAKANVRRYARAIEAIRIDIETMTTIEYGEAIRAEAAMIATLNPTEPEAVTEHRRTLARAIGLEEWAA